MSQRPHPSLHVNEQVLVARMIISGAKISSERMDRFVQWALTGLAAALTFLVAQPHLSRTELALPGTLFLLAAGLGIVGRYLALLVAVGTKASQEAEKLHDGKTSIDFARVFIIYMESTPVSLRWSLAWAAQRMLEGDLTAAARGFLRIALIQNLIGGAVTIIVLTDVWLLLNTL